MDKFVPSPSGPADKSVAEWDGLITACQAGDRGAMRQVFEACGERVYALMVRMVGQQDADDMTQQAFLQAFRKLDRFAGHAKFETWLYRVAMNEALQHLRRKKMRETQPLVVDPPDAERDHLVERERIELVRKALARIEPELRAILALKEEEGLSYRQLAEALAIPEGTVGSRLNRARKELHKELTKLGFA